MMFGLLFITTFPFYTSQWEEYHTHVIRTSIGFVGVTEGIVV